MTLGSGLGICPVDGRRPNIHRRRTRGFAGAIAHMPDMGGRRQAPDNKDIYEGLQIPILKLYDAGRPNETLIEMICQNVRVPDEVMGDIHAMVAPAKNEQRPAQPSCRIRTRRPGRVAAEIIGCSEAAMRRAVSKFQTVRIVRLRLSTPLTRTIRWKFIALWKCRVTVSPSTSPAVRHKTSRR